MAESSPENQTTTGRIMIKSHKQKNITPKKAVSKNEPTKVDKVIAEIMPKNLKGSKGFLFVFFALIIAILWTGIVTAHNIHQYRKNYGELQQIKNQYMKLEIEYRRLLIAQQTFSTTQKIASRARSELNMHFPTFQHKMVLQPTHLSEINNTSQTIEVDEALPSNTQPRSAMIDQEVSQ